MKKRSTTGRWYDKVAAFKVEDLFSRKREPGPRRTVFINENLPDEYRDQKGRVKKDHVYATNQVITSKYTVITFLPRNLLEQFRRVANVFFLGIAILQFFPKFSTISPGLVILPLLIVLAITAAKDGYEDVKRHQSDRRVNHSLVRVLTGGEWVNPNVMERKAKTFVRGMIPTMRRSKGVKLTNSGGEELVDVISNPPTPQIDTTTEYDDVSEQEHHILPQILHHHDHRDRARPHWKKTPWEDVAVGDFVKIMDNESFPTDILICSTSEDENVAFVETKNLDGETNLKSRNAVPALTHIRSAADCASTHNVFRIDCDRPDTNMYKLNAAVRVGKEVFPVDMQMMLLRGTVLRNTKWVIGLVLYTGGDTRIVMNSGGTPSKRSKVEREMNPQVFINLLLLAAMAVTCGVVDSILEHRDYPKGAPWLFEANRPGDNPSINGLITFFFALITFQNIVPISLYISIEFVRTCQAAFIYFDSEIYYKKTDQATLARSWNLSDDLGQVEYIFSDKTGTLTQNSMVFRKCSIGGKPYQGDPIDEDADSPDSAQDEKEIEKIPPVILPRSIEKDGLTKDDQGLASDIPLADIGSSSGASSSLANKDPSPKTPPSDAAVPNPLEAAAVKVTVHFHDAELSKDLRDAVHAEPGSVEAVHARQLNGFFSVLALCHSVLTSVDPVTGAIEYKAQSPDEAALVQAAADMGFVFRGREREVLLLQTPFSGMTPEGDGPGSPISSGSSQKGGQNAEGLERYELLNILEFTSARKRMSVVLRKLDGEDGRLFLLSKGADNVIFERLKKGYAEDLKKETEKHLDEFASQGLRTLTLAYKVIPEEMYQAWSERYHEATVAMDDRDAKIEAVSDELEQDLRLLGATAIEDRLQDGVPETIADLKKAGIKIWVATGDKLETAIAIGHSTNLIGPDSNIIVIRGGREGRPVYEQIRHAVEEFFPGNGIIDDEGEVRDLENAVPPKSPTRAPSFFGQQQGNYGEGQLQRTQTGISSIVGSHNGDKPGGFVLVIDGGALAVALSDDRHKNLLLQLAMLCEGVICCRVSPLQKALVVHLVKDGIGAMTLAIGDGANDVSMIQAADVGVGISGEEGLQAVNSSDYAIAQFRFLKRLLLVHGHWSYYRNGNMILNFFYKNIVCIGVLWWFQIYCGWSSNYVLEYTYLLFWNSFWTLAPVIGIGLFDRVADDHVLMDLPELYRFGREGKWFGMRLFVVYMFDGVVQSAIIYFLILYTYTSTSARPDGYAVGLYEFSTTMAFSAVFAANFFNGLNTNVWTGWVFFAIFIGDLLIWVYTAIYNSISPGWFVTPVWGNNNFLFESAFYWLCLPLTILLALLPRYLYKAYKMSYAPDDIDIVRYIRKYQPNLDLGQVQAAYHDPSLAAMRRPASVISRATRTESIASLPARPSIDCRSASRTDMSTGVTSTHRGFDFSMEEGGVAMRRMQSNLSGRRHSRNLAESSNSPAKKRKEGLGHVLTLPRNFLRRKGSNAKDHPQ